MENNEKITPIHDETNTIGENENMQTVRRPMRHHRRDASNDKYFKIRNILNIIFMLGAIAGMALFYFHDRTTGTIVILTAMAFKMAECCFRFIRQ